MLGVLSRILRTFEDHKDIRKGADFLGFFQIHLLERKFILE